MRERSSVALAGGLVSLWDHLWLGVVFLGMDGIHSGNSEAGAKEEEKGKGKCVDE